VFRQEECEEVMALLRDPVTREEILAAQRQAEFAPIRSLLAPEQGYTYGGIVPLRTANERQMMGRTRSGQPIYGRAIEPAVPLALREGAESLVNLAEGTQTGMVNPEDVLNIMPMGAAASLLDEGIDSGFAAGMFVGRRNQRADQQRFARAEELFEKGESPERIHAETGIYYGRDMQPRQEFSDVGMVDESVLARGIEEAGQVPNSSYSIPFASLFPSDEFQSMFRSDKGYPKIKFMPDSEAKNNLSKRGYYDPRENSVTLNPYQVSFDSESGFEPTSLDDARSVLLHELQHTVQSTDNLDFGTTTQDASRRYTNFGMDVESAPFVREARERLSQMEGPRRDLHLANMADSAKFFEELSNRENSGQMARHLFNNSEWYKHGDQIVNELGTPPKRSGEARNEWIRQAAKRMSSKYKQEVMNAYGDNDYLLDMSRNEIKNLTRRLYRQAYPSNTFELNQVVRASEKPLSDSNLLFQERGDLDFNAYRRKLGEQEARAVQDRRNMTQAELEARFPEMDYSSPTQSWLDSVPKTPQGLLHLTRER
jgi:hypothetical protein